jgi:hypothetical protein
MEAIMPPKTATVEDERSEAIDAVYKNLNALADLSKHNRELVRQIYADLIRWTKLMKEILDGAQ